jgi:hypothetical protein
MSDQGDDDGSSREPNVDDAVTDLRPHGSETYKVLGEIDAPEGSGVLGHNTATSGTSAGVKGVVDSSDSNASGVFGEATASNGTVFGVFGSNASSTGSGAGVRAFASNGARGVYASATSGDALYASSDTGVGVLASANTGDAGRIDTFDGDATGIRGRALDNNNPSGDGYGVEGRTQAVGQGAAGVYGLAEKGSGQTYGVHGVTFSNESSAAGVRAVGTGDAAAVSAEGHVDVSKVGVAAYLSSDQTVADSTPTTVAFDTIENNRDDFGGFDTSTGVYTVQQDGDYHVDFQVRWASLFNSDTVVRYRLFINGSYSNGIDAETYTPDGSPTRSFSKALLGLSKGDELSIEVSQYSGSSKDIEGSDARTQVSIHRIG